MNEFKLTAKSKYLLKYLEENILANIPKIYNIYRTGIQQCVIDLNYNIIRANINDGNVRGKYQKEILTSIAMLDLYLSILLELDVVNKNKFMVVIRTLNEIKKMTMSWMTNEKVR